VAHCYGESYSREKRVCVCLGWELAGSRWVSWPSFRLLGEPHIRSSYAFRWLPIIHASITVQVQPPRISRYDVAIEHCKRKKGEIAIFCRQLCTRKEASAASICLAGNKMKRRESPTGPTVPRPKSSRFLNYSPSSPLKSSTQARYSTQSLHPLQSRPHYPSHQVST